jgi:hypothetical protein
MNSGNSMLMAAAGRKNAMFKMQKPAVRAVAVKSLAVLLRRN